MAVHGTWARAFTLYLDLPVRVVGRWACTASVQLAPTMVYPMRARLLLPPRIETYLSQRACVHLGMHKRIRLQRYSGYPENLTFLLSDIGTWDSVGQ